MNIVDRSNLIASITSINGMMNGGTGPQCPEMDTKTLKVEYHNKNCEGKSTLWGHSLMRMFQTICIIDNLNFTNNGTKFHSNQSSDSIKKKIDLLYKGDKETICYLNKKYNLSGPDLYPETWGLNRRPKERIVAYIKRVYNDHILRDSFCTGFEECACEYMTKMNKVLKTFDHTYYFSVATGERKKLREKQRDVFNHPIKFTKSFIGFDSDVS